MKSQEAFLDRRIS